MIPLDILFFGNAGYAAAYKKWLEKSGHRVFIHDDFTGLEFLDKKPDLGIIACFGKIIPKNVLEIPKYGFLNIHPSLLPRWRGPSPVRSAILHGDQETGLTIHLTTNRIDAGDIIFQKKFTIDQDDNYAVLEQKLFEAGAEILPDIIEKWLSGKIQPKRQNDAEATHSKKVTTKDGLIDWRQSADQIIRQIKAYSPDPGAYTYINGRRIKIKRAEIMPGAFEKEPAGQIFILDGWPLIKCGQNALKLAVLQPEGKKDMPGDAYLRGHKNLSISAKL